MIYQGQGALPGETYDEYENRIRRERRKKKIQKDPKQNGNKADQTNPQLGLENDEDFSKKAPLSFQNKIKKRIELFLKTITEKQYNSMIKRPQSNSKNGRPKNYLELDPQIAEEWVYKEFLVLDFLWKFDKVRKELCVEALEIEVGPDVPSLEKGLTLFI
jgi:hypothetical protein